MADGIIDPTLSAPILAEDGALSSLRKNLETGDLYNPGFGERSVPGVPPGAEPQSEGTPEIVFRDINGIKMGEDLRVRIKVPPKYLVLSTNGPNNELYNHGGIIFPYTPSISYEFKADYAAQTPMHTNFAINFYQRSSIGNISISGKFTVENDNDANTYLATAHLLKALTRMRSGGASAGDPDSGAAPPVCRLFAYGEMVLNNVPVVIQNFKIELPDSVDYYTVPRDLYAVASVPTVSTISITCIPMYSRREMQNFSVTGYLTDADYKTRGFI